MPIIEIEGLDGAGKSTQVAMIQKYLDSREIKWEYIHFPRFDSPFYGELIARFLRGGFGSVESVDPYLVSMIYAGDRKDARDLICEWLKQDKVVILDRYVYSNIAYQCAKLQGEDREKLKRWILDFEFGYNNLPRADIALLLDIPFDVTVSRLSQHRGGQDREYLNGGMDIHEQSLELQRNVRELYHHLWSENTNFVIISCADTSGSMLSVEDIFSKIKISIDKLCLSSL